MQWFPTQASFILHEFDASEYDKATGEYLEYTWIISSICAFYHKFFLKRGGGTCLETFVGGIYTSIAPTPEYACLAASI